MSDVKCARKPLEPRVGIYRLQPASESFEGLSLPHLPTDMQRIILAQFGKCIGTPSDASARCERLESAPERRSRLALLRGLCKFLATNLLAQLCMATVIAEGNQKLLRRDRCTNPSLRAALTDLFNRDVMTAMMMKAFTNGDSKHWLAVGPATFRCLKIVIKVHDAETKWYTKCLEEIENGRAMPAYRPGDSEEWQELLRMV